MKTFGLLLCMALVAGTLMATPIPAPTAMVSSALLQAIFSEPASQISTVNDLMNMPSQCGACYCDPGQACHLYSDGSCSCG